MAFIKKLIGLNFFIALKSIIFKFNKSKPFIKQIYLAI